jgi:hypothetical protein
MSSNCPQRVCGKDAKEQLPTILLSYQKPHKPVSSETIGKWIKKTLTKAGIDIKVLALTAQDQRLHLQRKLATCQLVPLWTQLGGRTRKLSVNFMTNQLKVIKKKILIIAS